MITEGYLARHQMGRRGMTGPALLDIAQDYALQCLHQHKVFDLGVVLKDGMWGALPGAPVQQAC